MDQQEQFFIYRDHTAVKANDVWKVLKQAIQALGLNSDNYLVHSFRIGRTSDLIKYGYKIGEVRLMGRWKSNAVYRYIHS